MSPPRSGRAVRILLAGASPSFDRRFAEAFARDERLELVGHTPDVGKAPGLVAYLEPEIVLLYVSAPGADGAETARLLRDEWPSTTVLALADGTSFEAVRPAVNAGASGFLLTDESPPDLLPLVALLLRS
jgi:DNA-binding NarL/FixJ family response regulator